MKNRKFKLIMAKIVEYSLKDINYDFKALTEEEILIYKNQRTIDALKFKIARLRASPEMMILESIKENDSVDKLYENKAINNDKLILTLRCGPKPSAISPLWEHREFEIGFSSEKILYCHCLLSGNYREFKNISGAIKMVSI